MTLCYTDSMERISNDMTVAQMWHRMGLVTYLAPAMTGTEELVPRTFTAPREGTSPASSVCNAVASASL